MMNNLKNIVVVAVLLSSTLFYGQKRQDRDKIKSLKIAFITEKIDLTSKEAEAFWPVYNDHEDKIDALRKTERTEIRSKLRNADDLSERDADELLQLAISLERDKSKLNLEYFKKVNKIISSKKTILLMKAEEDFKRRLIKQYRHKRGGGGYR